MHSFRAISLLPFMAFSACNSPQGSTDTGPWPSVDCQAIGEASGNQVTFYEGNPTYTDPVDASDSWQTCSPAQQDMDESLLNAADAYLETIPYMWSFLVLRNGCLVHERYFSGSASDQSNNIHSASKSILSSVVGIAIDQGYIQGVDQPISQILVDYFAGITDEAKRSITVGNLLTMTAGFDWVEDQTEYRIDDQDDWIQAILSLDMATAPGESFNYSTGQSHLLSAVLTEATGTSYCEFAHENLLDRIGITAEHWGRDPQGYFSGGFNLYMTPRELARYGQVVLDGGKWHGQQVIPHDWVATATSHQVSAGWGFGYGFLWWLRQQEGHHISIAWGYGGQMAHVIPDLGMVVVFTTNTRDYEPDFSGLDVVNDYLLPAVLE